MELEYSRWYTEEAWLTAENPHHLLTILVRQGVKSSRKYRLAACACCRVVWDRLDGAHRRVVDLAGQYAEGRIKYQEVQKALPSVKGDEWDARRGARLAGHRQARFALTEGILAIFGVRWSWPGPCQDSEHRELSRRFCRIFRDIFGNPFRPVSLEEHRTRDVQTLAAGIYAERDWARLGVLADALEDAGCADESVLEHCRAGGEHVPGCWVVDAALGKT